MCQAFIINSALPLYPYFLFGLTKELTDNTNRGHSQIVFPKTSHNTENTNERTRKVHSWMRRKHRPNNRGTLERCSVPVPYP